MIAAFPPARRILVVSLFALLLHAADAEAKGFFLLTWGESVFHVSQVAEPEQTALQERLHRGVALGYEYSYAGVFWLDLWTWDGQWCLYNGRTFWKLTPDQAAAILHTTADELDKPFLYTYPLGLVIIGVGFAGLVLVGTVFKTDEERVAGVQRDPRYAGAIELLAAAASAAPPDDVERRRDAIRGALPAAIQYLTAHGVDAKSAEKNLVLLLKRVAPSAIHDDPVASTNS